ncbi:MobA/MobL family protein [Mariprofundus aestuarium]|uniref:MobA/MobL family protein n=1 Tax=Mariprofundus aestuarium TaxID=1921086 RepID=A0A2K8L0A0_MARES|nr:MobA/MobL family protein [Mariprofundus aestuarium]ATX80708.1 MobA/MobL family protein [Mariprofundus aestuarium]
MAAYHLTLKVGSKGKATPHFNYICASGKYDAKRGVVHAEHGNMPLWAASDPALFWKASDEFERANGTAYRELEVALPRELPLPQQIELAKELAEEACGNHHAYSFAIHHTKAGDGGMNPHVHLQFSERIDDGFEREPQHYFKRANKKEPEKGGCVKDRSWQATKRGNQKVAESSGRLLDIRLQWEVMCNQALDDFGVDASVDCRSYADQGIELTPQPKVGASSWHRFQRTGEKNERFQRYDEVVQANHPIVCDLDKLRFQSLERRQNELIEERSTITRELNQLRQKRPDVRSRDEVIIDLLPRIKAGKSCLSKLKLAKQSYTKAHNRYQGYRQIMEPTLTWGNIGKKIKCWLDHSSKAGEQMLLKQARDSHLLAKREARALLRKAKSSPIMHDKAEVVIDGERKEHLHWDQNIKALRGRMSAINETLESTRESIALLQRKHPDIDAPEQVQPQEDIGLHLSLRM